MAKKRRQLFVSGTLFIVLIWMFALYILISQPGSSQKHLAALPTLVGMHDSATSPEAPDGIILSPSPTPVPVEVDNAPDDYQVAENPQSSQSVTAYSPNNPVLNEIETLTIVPVPNTEIPNTRILRFNLNVPQTEIDNYIASFGGVVVQRIESLNTFIVHVPIDFVGLPEAAIVAESEPDYYVGALLSPPNDAYYASQWNLPAVKAPEAWALLPSNVLPVNVGVIDSGICANHRELEGRIVAGWDFVENDADPQDTFGHGCGVAGVIAANANNNLGIAGVAPHVRIVPLRVLDSKGLGSYSNVAAALVYAADHGIKIVNLSLGGSNPSSTLQNAVDYAVDKGVTIIAAAGNTGKEQILYPVAYDGVIGVGSVDANLQRSSFSNYGPTVDLYAPGSNIMTLSRDGAFRTMSGTSLAAPHVTAIAAIELSLGRSLKVDGGIVSVQGLPGPIVNQPGTNVAPVCDTVPVNTAAVNFFKLLEQRQNNPDLVTESDIRSARAAYLEVASGCFQAIYAVDSRFDGGGYDLITGESYAQFRLFGTKWGHGSPFDEAQPPALPGGIVRYSFMGEGTTAIIDLGDKEGVQQGLDGAFSIESLVNLPNDFVFPANKADLLLMDIECLSLTAADLPDIQDEDDLETLIDEAVKQEIKDSFAAWEAIANIQFVYVVDSGEPFNLSISQGAPSSEIRIGAQFIDFIGGELGHAFYPGPVADEPGATGTGDVFLDAFDHWGCSDHTIMDENGQTIPVRDIGVVTLHEIGHAIGVSHQDPAVAAVMNPSYNATIQALQNDDIGAGRAIYGSDTLGQQTLLIPVITGDLATLGWVPIGNPDAFQLQITTQSDVDFQTLFLNVDLPLMTSAAQSYTTTTLANGNYRWRVRGHKNGWGPWNSPTNANAAFTISVSVPKLASPFNGAQLANGLVKFQWGSVAGSSNTFTLEIAHDATFTPPLINTLTTTQLSLTLQNRLPDGTYFWRVKANAGNFSPVWRFVIDSQVPSQGSAQVNGKNVTLTWPPVAGATEYEVQLDTSPNFVGFLFIDKLFIDKLFIDKLFIDKLNSEGLFIDKLFIDKLFIDKLFIDKLFIDKLFIDKLFIDKLITDFLFIDKLFIDKLFIDKLFIDKLFIDKLTTNSTTLIDVSEGVHYWRVRARRPDGTWTGFGETQSFVVNTRENVVINEIFPGEPAWIELYNNGQSAADLTGWQFAIYNPDGTIASIYEFPSGFVLEKGAYVVLHEQNLGGDNINTTTELFIGANTINWPLESPIGSYSLEEENSASTGPKLKLRPRYGARIVRSIAMYQGPVTIFVDTSDIAPADDGACGLIEAIHNANTDSQMFASAGECNAGEPGDADTIELDGTKTYTLTSTDNNNHGQNGLPSITSEIIVNGNGATIKRDSITNMRLFHIASTGDLTLSNLILRDGDSGSDSGGAVYNASGILLIQGSILTNNVSGKFGGAVYSDGGSLTILGNTSFTLNIANDGGGGLAADNLAVLSVSDAIFDENSALSAGGLYASGTSLIQRSLFTDNQASLNGSAIVVQGETDIINITVTSNDLIGGAGGAIATLFDDVRISFVTITDNTSTGVFGGGIYNSNGATVTVKNSIVVNNQGDCSNDSASFSAEGVNFDSDGTCASLDGNFSTVTISDLDLQPLAYSAGASDTIALGINSIAINVAVDCTDASSNIVTSDQRSIARPQDGVCDVGAFEANGSTITVDGANITVANDGQCSIVEAITNANNNSQQFGSAGECEAGFGDDTIILSEGAVYTLTVANNPGNGLPIITGNLTIKGNEATIMRSNAATNFRIFSVNAGVTLALYDLTISNGRGDNGGGIVNKGALALDKVTMNDNHASDGSGDGGAIFSDASATSLHIRNSTFNENLAPDRGGAIRISSGIATIINSTLSGNTANTGSAIYKDVSAGDVNLSFVTITNNGTSGDGALYSEVGPFRVKNSIVVDNIGPSCEGPIADLGGNYSDQLTCSGFDNTTVTLDVLGRYGGGIQTHKAETGSASINGAADCLTIEGSLVTADQRGVARPQGVACDAGAFEIDTAQTGPTYTVTTTEGFGDGICGVNLCTLAEAVSIAENDGLASILDLANGAVYTIENSLSVTTSITINGNMATIDRDTGGATFPIISMDNAAANLTLNNLTIQNGDGIDGGGINKNDGSLTLNNISLKNNQSDFNGPAINNLNGSLTINGALFENNSATGDSGALYMANGSANIDNAIFRNNSTTGNGGGIFATSGSPMTITDSTFSDNQAIDGAGLHIDAGSTVNVLSSTFNNNTASGNGGAIYVVGTANVLNSTFSDNTAVTGGALYNETGTLNISFSTLTLNNASNAVNGNAVFRNTIVADNNVVFNCDGGSFSGSGVNFADDVSCGFSFTNTAIPLINVTLANNGGPTQTHALATGSPAINTATNCTDISSMAVTVDQRGVLRPQGINCDAGAFELEGGLIPTATPAPPTATPTLTPTSFIQSNPYTVTSTSSGSFGNCLSNLCTLIDAINAANADGIASTINLGSGQTYSLTQVNNNTNGLNGLPSITSNIIINGNGSTITRGGIPAFRILHVSATGNLTLNNVNVSGGSVGGPAGEDSGGGIYLATGGQLTLNSTMVQNNSVATDGAGIYNAGGTLNIGTNSIISNNHASASGGGIYANGGTTNITNSQIIQNDSVLQGGAITVASGASANITNSLISGNLSGSLGGGIFNFGTMIIDATTIEANSASTGAVIDNGVTMTITNSTISGNNGQGVNVGCGGGFFATNVTISGNTGLGGNFCGGTYLNFVTIANNGTGINSAASGGPVHIKHSIVANNIGANCTNTGGHGYDATGTNFTNTAACGAGFTNIATPLINTTLMNNGGPTKTHAVIIGSPALNSAIDCQSIDLQPFVTGVPVTTDQRGILRPQSGVCDAGAFERANQTPVANDDARNTLPNTPITLVVLENDTDANGDALSVTGVSDPPNGSAFINSDPPGPIPPICDLTSTRTPLTASPDVTGAIDTPVDCDKWVAMSPIPTSASGTISGALAGKSVWPLIYSADESQPRYYPQGTTDTGCTNPKGAIISGNDWDITAYFGREGFAEQFQLVLTVVNTGGAADTTFKSWLVNGCNTGSFPGFLPTELPTGVFEVDAIQIKTTLHHSITYTPDIGFTGNDAFTYTISDGDGGIDTASVAIVVGDIAQAGDSEFEVNKVTDSNDGLCGVLDCSLREAVIAANAKPGSNVILVSAGTYNLSIAGANENAAATGDLDVTDSVNIYGSGSHVTIIDGGGLDRVFHIVHPNTSPGISVRINGFMVRNGQADNGGGLLNQNFHNGSPGTVELVSVFANNNVTNNGGGIYHGFGGNAGTLTMPLGGTIENNTATNNGGGIVVGLGNVQLTNVTLRNNIATNGSGGGAYNTGNGLSLTRSIVEGNKALNGSGGGIASISTGLNTITDSTLKNNQAGLNGGGLAVFNTGGGTIINSTLNGNSATNGGAVFNAATLTMSNTTLSGNSAINSGGALRNTGTVNIVNTTFTFNNKGVSNIGGVVTLTNTLLANMTDNCVGGVTNGGGNISNDITCPAGFSLISTNALQLGALANNGGPTFTHAINEDSPLVNAGLNGPCPLIDQRGVTRDANCDVGAYEFSNEQPPEIGTKGGGAGLLNKGVAVDFVRLGNAAFGAPAGTNWTGGAVALPTDPAKTVGRDPASSDTDHRSDWFSQRQTFGGQNAVKVVINEIFTGSTDAIELYNQSLETVRMDGWQVFIYDGDGVLQYTYTFPTGFTLQPNTYLVLREGPNQNSIGQDPMLNIYLGAGNFIDWSDTSGKGAVELTNGLSHVDFVRFGELGDVDYFALNDVEPSDGVSWIPPDPLPPLPNQALGRDNVNTDTDAGLDWIAQTPSLGSRNPAEKAAANDKKIDAIVIPNVPFRDTQTTVTATADINEDLVDSLCAANVGHTVWYKYTATFNGPVRFQTDGSDYNTVLLINDATANTIICDTDGGEGSRSRIDLTLVQGHIYFIMVGSELGVGGNLVFSAMPPLNDDFDSAIPMASLPFSNAQNTIAASLPLDDPLPSCGIGVGRTIWYSFTALTADTLLLQTVGSNFDTMISLWTGTRGNLLEAACADNSDGSVLAELQFNPIAGQTYFVMVGGNLDGGGNLVFQSGLLVAPPNDNFASVADLISPFDVGTLTTLFTFVEDTAGATTEALDPTPSCGNQLGKSVWFRYTATDNAKVVFETLGSDYDTVLSVWTGTTVPTTAVLCNDDAGPALDSSSVEIEGVANTTYFIMVSGYHGVSGNLNFKAYKVAVPPPNDMQTGAILIRPLPFTNIQVTTGATSSGDPAPSCDGTAGKGIWYKYEGNAINRVLRFHTSGSDFDTILSVWVDVAGTWVEVTCDNDSGLDGTSNIVMNSGENVTLYVLVSGASGASGTAQLNVQQESGAPPHDEIATPRLITNLPYNNSDSTVLAKTALTDPIPSCDPVTGKTVWYKYTPTTNPLLLLNTEGSDFDTVLSIWTSGSGNLTEVACDDNGGTNGSSLMEFPAEAGQTYFIMVSGKNGLSGDYNLHVSQINPPANDNVATPHNITNDIFVTQTTRGATNAPDDPLTCNATTGRTVWFTYHTGTLMGPTTLSFSTEGSDFNTVMAIYEGLPNATSIPVACDNVSGANFTAKIDGLKAKPNTTYYLMVGGSFSQSGQLNLTVDTFVGPANDEMFGAIEFAPLPFDFTQDTSGATTATDDPLTCGVLPAKTVWFNYTASSDDLLHISLDGTDFNTVVGVFTGALTPVACEFFGDIDIPLQNGETYFVMVGGWNGDSGQLSLHAQLTTIPANDQKPGALIIPSLPYSNTQDTTGATSINDPALACDFTFGKAVWYQYTAQVGDGLLHFDTDDSTFSTVMGVFVETGAGLQPVACGVFDGVEFAATPGQTYFVMVGGYQGQSGELHLNASSIATPTNDDVSNAKQITLVPYNDGINTSGASDPITDPLTCQPGSAKSVWYKYTAIGNGILNLDTMGSDYSTVIAVYTGEVGDLQLLDCANGALPVNALVALADGTTLDIAVETNQTYYIMIEDADRHGGQLVLNVSGNIEKAPPSLTVTKTASVDSVPESGAPVTFTVIVQNSSVSENVLVDALTDDKFSGIVSTCDITLPASLAPGAFFTCEYIQMVSGNFGTPIINTVSASGLADGNIPVHSSAMSVLTVTDVQGSILVTKTANLVRVSEPGQNVQFTIKVENTSLTDSVTINSVVDNIFGDKGATCIPTLPATLAVGETLTCTFTALVSGKSGDAHINTITVTGQDDDGLPLTVANSLKMPIVCKNYNPNLHLKHVKTKLIAPYNTGVIVNTSSNCYYEVGLAAYQKVDNNIDNQILFSQTTAVIKPGQKLTLSVALPECSTQVDLFYGPVLPSLNGLRYGVRLLDFKHIGGGTFCVPTGESTTESIFLSLPAPNKPLNLTAETGDSQVILNWTDGATSETAFHLERRIEGEVTWLEIAVLLADTTTYSDSGLACGTGYGYRVRAFGNEQFSDFSNEANAMTTLCPPPAAPTNLLAAQVSDTEIDLAWTNNADNDVMFSLEVSSDGTTFAEVAQMSTFVYAYMDPMLACGTTIHFRVRALRNSDNQYSEYSPVTSLASNACPIESFFTSQSYVGLFKDGQWRFRTGDESSPEVTFNFGPIESGWLPIVGDWNGDGVVGVGLYKDGLWLLRETTFAGLTDTVFLFGTTESGWLPIVGDWDGDGTDGIGLYKESAWMLKQIASIGAPDIMFTYGHMLGELPVSGDWDNDGVDTVGLYHNGLWTLKTDFTSSEPTNGFTFGPGQTGWSALVGDWNGDGADTIGLYNEGLWRLRNLNGEGGTDVGFNFGLNEPGWLPVSGYSGTAQDLMAFAQGGPVTLPVITQPIITDEPETTPESSMVPEVTETTVPADETTAEPEVTDAPLPTEGAPLMMPEVPLGESSMDTESSIVPETSPEPSAESTEPPNGP